MWGAYTPNQRDVRETQEYMHIPGYVIEHPNSAKKHSGQYTQLTSAKTESFMNSSLRTRELEWPSGKDTGRWTEILRFLAAVAFSPHYSLD